MVTLRVPLVPRGVRFAAVVAVALVILAYSIVPAPGSGTFRTGPLGLFPFSVWLHLLAYAGLAAALAYALHDSPRPDWQVLLLVFGIVVAYGVSIELLQTTLPSRTGAFVDALVNATGAGLAVTVWRLGMRYVRFYRVRRLREFELPVE